MSKRTGVGKKEGPTHTSAIMEHRLFKMQNDADI
jgi:hypothetical protein